MKEHYVTYEQAVKLKELGFDGNKLDHYIRQGYYKFPNGYISPIKHDGDGILVQFRKEDAEKIPAPRLDQAQAWLREIKGWHIQVRINGVRSAYWYEIWSTTPNGPVYGTPDDDTFRRGQHETYEQALSAGIDKALELLTNKS